MHQPKNPSKKMWRRAIVAIVALGAALFTPLIAAQPAQAVTLRCTPANYYVPLAYVPPSFRAANEGCVYRQAFYANGYASAWTWRGAGAQRCLNIWKGSMEYRIMTWYQKYTVMPAWCSYYAGHFLWYGY